MTDAPPNRAQRSSAIRSPLDFAGGLFLLAIAAVGYAGAFTLPFGQLSGIGSGLMPKVVAVLVATFGVALVLQGLAIGGDRLERWAVRGPLLVLAAVLVFAFTIRLLGLVVAGPLCFIDIRAGRPRHAPRRGDRLGDRGDSGLRLPVQGPAQPADPVRPDEHPSAPARPL